MAWHDHPRHKSQQVPPWVWKLTYHGKKDVACNKSILSPMKLKFDMVRDMPQLITLLNFSSFWLETVEKSHIPLLPCYENTSYMNNFDILYLISNWRDNCNKTSIYLQLLWWPSFTIVAMVTIFPSNNIPLGGIFICRTNLPSLVRIRFKNWVPWQPNFREKVFITPLLNLVTIGCKIKRLRPKEIYEQIFFKPVFITSKRQQISSHLGIWSVLLYKCILSNVLEVYNFCLIYMFWLLLSQNHLNIISNLIFTGLQYLILIPKTDFNRCTFMQ